MLCLRIHLTDLKLSRAQVNAIRSEVSRDDGSKLVTTTITEDKRLAAAVKTLDHETSIVPRGVLRTSATGAVEHSRTFEGQGRCMHFVVD